MNIRAILKHALQMVRREYSSGEYRLTLFSLVVGVTAVMSLSLTSSRIEQALFTQASDLIGGDLVVTSSDWSDDVLIDSAKSLSIDHSLSLATSTMVAANDQFMLSSVRAVDEQYPLKGKISVKDNRQSQTLELKNGPEPGTAWVEKRLLDRLGIDIGDSVDVGYAKLKVEKILEMEPDRGGEFYSLYPRVLFNYSDVEQSRLIQPGSRVDYKLMLAGEASALENWRLESQSQLKVNQRLLDPQSSQTRISSNLERASAFINLGGLMSVILCGIAVSLAASRHARRHINQVALLRCFGLTSRQVNTVYSFQLLTVAIPAIVTGMIFGYLIHLFLIQILADFFATTLPRATFKAWLSGPLTAICMLIGFGLPSIVQLSKTPPARVLRRELSATYRAPVLSGVLALSSLTLIAWWQTNNLILAGISVGGTIAVIGVLVGIILIILKIFSRRFIKHPVIRGAYANLLAKPTLTAMQITGFGLSSFAIALILLFRHDLFMQWNQEIPEDAPNRFVFDIFDDDKSEFENLLKSQNISSVIYPIVRGRLTKINGEVVQQAVTKEDSQEQIDEEALQRDLALTQVSFLPKENHIVAGNYFNTNQKYELDSIPVSVESELAENLSLKLNDKLEFIIEGQTLGATITSLRTVNWENFNPNFYMLFPPGALDQFSQTWLTSYFLPAASSDFDTLINKTFPATTVIDVDFILKRIRKILDQVSSAMELIFSMTVLSGVAVFWAALLITFDEKQKQAALLRALGASQRHISQRFTFEQLLIGLLSGLLAAFSLVIVSWLISSKVLDIDWNLPLLYVLGLPLILMLVLAGLASFQIKRIIQTPPYRVLQKAETA